MTLVSLSHHYLGPNACPSTLMVCMLSTPFAGTCSATAGLVLMGDSPFPNMQSRVLSPFNCLSQRVYSLFNFLGIMKQLSMYPWVPLLQESVLKKKTVCITHLGEGHNIFWNLMWFSFSSTWLDIEMGPVPLQCYLIHIGKGVGFCFLFLLLLRFIWAQLDFSYERGD